MASLTGKPVDLHEKDMKGMKDMKDLFAGKFFPLPVKPAALLKPAAQLDQEHKTHNKVKGGPVPNYARRQSYTSTQKRS